MPEGNRRNFFVSLESLRGVAALIVIIYHAEWLNPLTQLEFFQNGPLMVDFFFVLSGFVIYHSYGGKLSSGRDVARFLWLRFGRLYPLHVTFLLAFLGIEIFKHAIGQPSFQVNNAYSFVTNLLLMQSLGLHKNITYNYPAWSISVEFYTYVLFAITYVLARTLQRFTMIAIAIVVASAVILLADGFVSLEDAGCDFGFFRCAFGFFMGVLSCEVYFSLRASAAVTHPKPLLRALPLAALSGTVSLLIFGGPESHTTYLMPFLSALVVVSLVLWPPAVATEILHSSFLQWLGRVSYSVYMTHAALVWVVKTYCHYVLKLPRMTGVDDVHPYMTSPWTGSILLVIYVACVLVLSHFTYHWIEAPFRDRSRRMADRWFARRPSETLAVPPSPSVSTH